MQIRGSCKKFCHWVRITSVLRFIKHVFITKKVREKSRECHNHKPQPFPDPKRKRKPTNLNKHKPNKRTKSTKISFPKRGNRNTERTEKHKNKTTRGKTQYKSPRRTNHKATKSKTNTGTTAIERSVEQTTGRGGGRGGEGGLKHFYKPSKYFPFTETHFCKFFTQSRKADK